MDNDDHEYRPSSSHSSTASSAPPHLPPIYPQVPGRPLHLPPIPGLLPFPRDPNLPSPYPQQQQPSDAALDAGLRRLLLLQSLAAQQQQILQAARSLGVSSLPSPASFLQQPNAATPPPTPAATTSNAQRFPLPPPHRTEEGEGMPWTSVIDGLNNVDSPSNGGDSRRGSFADSPSPGAAINAREIQLAQAQLDAWSQIVFTTSPAAGLPALPPPLPATFSPPAFDWTAALYPSPTLPPAAIATSSTAPSQGEDTTPSPPAPAGGRRSAKAKGKAKVEAEEKYKGSDEEEEGGEEDKRKRNTAASARFRAKKKQRDAELQQTSTQLRDRLADLEKQASSLKAENQWLRDLISEKTEPRVHPRGDGGVA